MKTLLAVLQLSLVSQVPAPGPEQPVSSAPAERKRVMTSDFEDDTLEPDLFSAETPCYPDRRYGYPHRLIRIREDFSDKVMQSMAEM